MQARFSTPSSLAAHHRRLMASCAESGCLQVRQMSGSGAKLSGRTVGESLCMSKSVAAHDTGLIASASNLPTRCRQQCSLVVATVRGPSCDPTNTAIARTRCRPVGRCAAWCRILGWHPQRGPVPVHPGRVRHRCSSHGKLEPVRPDTSRFTGPKAADGITAPAARTNPRAGIRPASGHRSEAPQREGSDGPSCHPAQFTDMQRQCQEVNGCDRPCASPSRHFLAKSAVGCDRGDHPSGTAAGGDDDVANCPSPPTACNHCEPIRSGVLSSGDPPPCAVCRHRLPAVHRCRAGWYSPGWVLLVSL